MPIEIWTPLSRTPPSLKAPRGSGDLVDAMREARAWRKAQSGKTPRDFVTEWEAGAYARTAIGVDSKGEAMLGGFWRDVEAPRKEGREHVGGLAIEAGSMILTMSGTIDTIGSADGMKAAHVCVAGRLTRVNIVRDHWRRKRVEPGDLGLLDVVVEHDGARDGFDPNSITLALLKRRSLMRTWIESPDRPSVMSGGPGVTYATEEMRIDLTIDELVGVVDRSLTPREVEAILAALSLSGRETVPHELHDDFYEPTTHEAFQAKGLRERLRQARKDKDTELAASD